MAELQHLFRHLAIKLSNSSPDKLKRTLRFTPKTTRNCLQLENTFLRHNSKQNNENKHNPDINLFEPQLPLKNLDKMYFFQKKAPNQFKFDIKYMHQSNNMDKKNMSDETSSKDDSYQTKLEENLKKLNQLRSLPRGTNIESRVAAIKSLLGKQEVFRTLQNLRWPQGILCPRCHSKNIVVKQPPRDAEDDRTYYDCLNCRKKGEPSGFDDLTGLGEGGAGDIQRWILCWYLLGFCSLSQVAKLLGLSMAETLQLAEMGAQFTEHSHKKADVSPEKGFFAKSFTEKRKETEKHKKEQEHKDKMTTESESLGLYKPGPKSRK